MTALQPRCPAVISLRRGRSCKRLLVGRTGEYWLTKVEHVVSVVGREPHDRPIEIYAGDPAEPIDAARLAVSVVSQSGHDDRYVLYYLSKDGRVLALSQWDALGDVYVEAQAYTGIDPTRWTRCDVPLLDGWERILLPANL
jgi:hypothetical protein